ncbi:MAG: glycosyltransferase family 2 protein [Bacteroidota bacterium]
MKKKVNLTAIIPTFNEEIHIEEALESVSFADEIIVIDSYSTDKTVELVKKHKVRLLQRKFDDFSSQKNFAIEKATHDWVFILDADERIPKALKEEILQTVNSHNEEVAYWIYRTTNYMGKDIKYSGLQNDKVIRLLKKEYCRYDGLLVHEEIEAEGKVGFLENKIKHYSYKGIDNIIYKRNKFAQLQAQALFNQGKKPSLFHFIIKPPFRFIKHFILQRGFLDGFQGFMISSVYSYTVFMRYVKLWLLNHNLK